MNQEPRIIVALDFAEKDEALTLVARLQPEKCRLKVGKEMFTRFGPSLIETLQGKGFEVFLDLKFHDIPATVSKACRAAAELGVWMVNVHALGGSRMLAGAREGIDKAGGKTKLLAVTVLTSMDDQQLAETGFTLKTEQLVQKLAGLAQDNGCDGVVCSAREARMLRGLHGPDFCLLTPGIRPAGAALNDQKRVVTPAQAIKDGVDYLVIGRPITQAEDPMRQLMAIEKEVALAGAK